MIQASDLKMLRFDNAILINRMFHFGIQHAYTLTLNLTLGCEEIFNYTLPKSHI